jgi:hypothetical protein
VRIAQIEPKSALRPIPREKLCMSWYFVASETNLLAAAPGWLRPDDDRIARDYCHGDDAPDEFVLYSPIAEAPKKPDLRQFAPVRIRAWYGQSPKWIDLGPPLLEGLALSLRISREQFEEPFLIGPRDCVGYIWRVPEELAHSIAVICDAEVPDTAYAWFKHHGYSDVKPFEELLRLIMPVAQAANAADTSIFIWTGRTI